MRMWFFVTYAVLQAALVASVSDRTEATPGTTLQNPSTLSFDHDGVNVSGFVVYLTREGGPASRIDLGALRADAKGHRTTAIPHLPAGTYRVEIAAYNGAGESPRVPATPPRFEVTADRGNRTNDPSRSSGGLLGRIYRGIVGSDEESDGK
jgi:hypothetical protein